eukprot:TRINITY_DN1134_c0_g1_i3.p1 TRINITY_DN1134_c0_g1~~TRINITY_DN1134_c0_g1_i3.p1  ORF type:complete len:416 (-),score=171.64 TRINITY_DN1134_c0_g1_i3:3-1250(-)
MSGGGTKKQRGGMTKSVASIDPEKARAQLNEQQQITEQKMKQLREVRERLEKIENEIEQGKLKIRKLQTDVPRNEIEIKELSKQREDLTQRIPKMEENTKPDEQEQEQMQILKKEIKKRENEFHKAEADAKELVQKIETIQSKIMRAGGDKLKDAKERVEQISNGIDEANQLVTKLEVANNACVSALEKAAKVKDKNNELIEELEKTLQQKSEEIDNLTHSAEEVEKQVAVLKGQFEEKAEEVKKLFGDLEEEKKKNTGNRSLEVDLQHQLEDVMKIVNENTARMADLDKKLKKLASSLEGLAIDEDEVLELRIYDDEELEKRNVDELNTAIAALKQELTSMKPNMTAIKEYKQKSKECLEKQQVLDSVTAARDDKKKEYETLRRKRYNFPPSKYPQSNIKSYLLLINSKVSLST